jgi:hypothetical protein
VVVYRFGCPTGKGFSPTQDARRPPAICVKISLLQSFAPSLIHLDDHGFLLTRIDNKARSSIVWAGEYPSLIDTDMPSVFRLDDVAEGSSTDTSTNAPSILAINGFFCGFTIIVVLLRIFVRVRILKTMGIDDYLIAAAAV